MKKIITWLASFILVSSTVPTVSQLVLTTSFSKSSINNNYLYKNDSYWSIYNDLQHKGNFVKFNDSLGVFNDKEYQKTYFVNKDGQFTELKLNGKSVIGTFSQFNDNQGVFITTTASYFLNNSGDFSLINIDGSIPNQKCTFYSWTEKMGILIVPSSNNDYDYVYTLSENRDVYLNDKINFQFALHFHVTNFGVLNNDYCLLRSNYCWYGEHDNSFILQPNKSFNKLENNFNNFVKFTNEMSIFSNANDEAFSFEIGTKEKVNTFEQKINNTFSTSGVIKDVDNSKFKGKVANNDVNFDLTSKYLTEVKIDGQVQPIADKKINIKITSEGKHDIFIKNKLTSDLTYNIYIKKQPTKDKIINITSHQLINYVGVDNKGKWIDVL